MRVGSRVYKEHLGCTKKLEENQSTTMAKNNKVWAPSPLLKYMFYYVKNLFSHLYLGAVHILRNTVKRREGVCQSITFYYKGEGGDGKILLDEGVSCIYLKKFNKKECK